MTVPLTLCITDPNGFSPKITSEIENDSSVEEVSWSAFNIEGSPTVGNIVYVSEFWNGSNSPNSQFAYLNRPRSQAMAVPKPVNCFASELCSG